MANVDPKTVELALKGLQIVGGMVANGVRARQEMRKLAEQLGVSKVELDAADERFMRTYTDPLAPLDGGG